MASEKSSSSVYKAQGATSLLLYDPEMLTLVTDPEHYLYDPRVNDPIDEAMVKNIMVYGVRQPIMVTKNNETGDIEVVAGRQRVKSCIEANKRLTAEGSPTHRVPARAVSGKPTLLAGLVAVENAIRKDPSPMQRAEQMRKLADLNMGEEEIGMTFGITVQTVKATLDLLTCCADVKKAVDQGKIGVNHAKALAKMEPPEQREKLAELLSAGEGKTGHAKSKAQKKVVKKGPSMKGKKEILAEIENSKGARKEALQWVLGLE